MKIKKIQAFPMRYPEPNDHNNTRYILLVRVETDDGLVGWGEAITMWPEASRAAKIIVEEGMQPVLLGQDPRDTYALWLATKEKSWWYGHGGIASFGSASIVRPITGTAARPHGARNATTSPIAMVKNGATASAARTPMTHFHAAMCVV